VRSSLISAPSLGGIDASVVAMQPGHAERVT
jgi:hypothetical protein